MPKVRCTETGRGPKGSIFVCSTPEGDVTIRALKEAPYTWRVFSEYPYRKYETIMRVSRRRQLRILIEEWLERVIGKK